MKRLLLVSTVYRHLAGRYGYLWSRKFIGEPLIRDIRRQVVQVRETGLYTFQTWVRWRRDQVRLVVSKNTMHPPSSYTYQGAIVRFIETDDSADTWTKSEIKDFPGSVSPDPWTKLEIKDISLAAGSSVLLGLRSDNGMGPVMYDDIEF